MAKRDDIKAQIKKQNDEVYGENTLSGSSPDPESDDDIKETLEKTVGTKIKPGDEFYLADEIVSDEEAVAGDDSGFDKEQEEEE